MWLHFSVVFHLRGRAASLAIVLQNKVFSMKVNPDTSNQMTHNAEQCKPKPHRLTCCPKVFPKPMGNYLRTFPHPVCIPLIVFVAMKGYQLILHDGFLILMDISLTCLIKEASRNVFSGLDL